MILEGKLLGTATNCIFCSEIFLAYDGGLLGITFVLPSIWKQMLDHLQSMQSFQGQYVYSLWGHCTISANNSRIEQTQSSSILFPAFENGSLRFKNLLPSWLPRLESQLSSTLVTVRYLAYVSHWVVHTSKLKTCSAFYLYSSPFVL